MPRRHYTQPETNIVLSYSGSIAPCVDIDSLTKDEVVTRIDL